MMPWGVPEPDTSGDCDKPVGDTNVPTPTTEDHRTHGVFFLTRNSMVVMS